MHQLHSASAVVIRVAHVTASADVIRTSVSPALVSLVTATSPSIVTKTFVRVINGITGARQIMKGTNADVYEGEIKVRFVNGLSDFASLLSSLGTNQCLVYGVPPRTPVKLVTEKRWVAMGQPATHVARTKRAFSWHSGPGVTMLDYDAPKDGAAPMGREVLIATVRTACPGLTDAQLLWTPSASSNIYDSAAGEELRGICGQRLYLIVRDAQDVERAGKALLCHLWAANYGRYEVSASGFLLDRGLFDGSVWQANRIDFAAGAHCSGGLEQRRGSPILIDGSVEIVDSKLAIPEPSQAVRARAFDRVGNDRPDRPRLSSPQQDDLTVLGSAQVRPGYVLPMSAIGCGFNRSKRVALQSGRSPSTATSPSCST